MQVTLKGSRNQDGTGGQVEVTLCSGPSEGPLDPFDTSFSRQVQTVQPTRGDWDILIPRGLRSVAFPLDIVKEFETLGEAEQFCLTHEGTLPYNCTLKVVSDTGGGGNPIFTAQHAEVTALNCRRMGKSVHISYRIVATQLG